MKIGRSGVGRISLAISRADLNVTMSGSCRCSSDLNDITLDPLPFKSMTPDSIISWYKSFPSRVLSPTPANTE